MKTTKKMKDSFLSALALLPDERAFESKIELMLSDRVYTFDLDTWEGGGTESEELIVDDFDYSDDETITVEFSIDYKEVMPTSCCDQTRDVGKYRASFVLIIDRESGDGKVTGSGEMELPDRYHEEF